jgi:hypothetical protein
MGGMAQTLTRKTRPLTAPLRPPSRQRALYEGKDLTNKSLRYQGAVSFTGGKAMESCRKFLSTQTGRDLDRISDADVFEFAARCWQFGQEVALDDLRKRGHVQ